MLAFNFQLNRLDGQPITFPNRAFQQDPRRYHVCSGGRIDTRRETDGPLWRGRLG